MEVDEENFVTKVSLMLSMLCYFLNKLFYLCIFLNFCIRDSREGKKNSRHGDLNVVFICQI